VTSVPTMELWMERRFEECGFLMKTFEDER
jgi:hypothetical protein